MVTIDALRAVWAIPDIIEICNEAVRKYPRDERFDFDEELKAAQKDKSAHLARTVACTRSIRREYGLGISMCESLSMDTFGIPDSKRRNHQRGKTTNGIMLR